MRVARVSYQISRRRRRREENKGQLYSKLDFPQLCNDTEKRREAERG